AGAAGHAVDQSLGAFEDAVQHALGSSHLPQHVHVDAAAAIGLLVGDAGLMNAAADRKGNKLLMALAPCAAAVDLRYQVALPVIGIGVDAGERTDAAGRRPSSRAFAIGYGDALAALDQRQYFPSGDDDRLERLHAASGALMSGEPVPFCVYSHAVPATP